MQKKRDILSEKRESGMSLKKREFTPESGNVDTYANTIEDILTAWQNEKMEKTMNMDR